MKHIILEANLAGAVGFNIVDLQERLSHLADTRDRRGKIYPLSMVLAVVILAKLAGEDKPSGISEWIRLRRDSFVTLFSLKHWRMPCLNVIQGILRDVVSLEELERIFAHYLHETYGGQQSQLLAIDGKTIRGTIPKGGTQGVHLMAAYLPQEGVVLKQVEVGNKENEISAAPELLQTIDLKNRIVCGDAMQTQRQLSVAVLAQGGDYIWFLKENQPTLRADVAQFFMPPQMCAGWSLPQLPRVTAKSSNVGHGRLETRTLTLIADEQQFLDWPGVKQVFMLERRVRHLRTGQETCEVVYGITSCCPTKCTAALLLSWTRQYWGIENGLHYRRDVTLREDLTRFSEPALAKTMAALNNFVIALAQKLGYSNLASARRVFNAKIAAQPP